MIRAAILVVSSKIADGREEDKGKAALVQLVESIPASLASYDAVPDERQAIRDRLVSLCEGGTADVVLTVGGTGVRPTDVVPEVTREVAEKEIPGIGEAMRLESLKKVQTAMLSRGTAGVRGRTLIVNTPGSPSGAAESLEAIVPVLDHALETLAGPHDHAGRAGSAHGDAPGDSTEDQHAFGRPEAASAEVEAEDEAEDGD